MSVLWPSTLPERPGLPTRDERQDARLRADPDQGPSLIRRRFTAAVRTIEVPVLFTGTERVAFDAFWKDTLDEGTLRFQWVDPVTDDPVMYRFVRPPSWAALRGDADPAKRLWRAGFELEILPGAFAAIVPTVEEAAASLVGTATLTAAGDVLEAFQSGAAALLGSASLTALGTAFRGGAAALTGSAAIAAAAVARRNAGASLVADAALLAAAEVIEGAGTVDAAAALLGSASLIAVAAATRAAAAGLTGTATLSATGFIPGDDIPAVIYNGFSDAQVWSGGTANAAAGQAVSGYANFTRNSDGSRQTVWKWNGTSKAEIYVDSDDILHFDAGDSVDPGVDDSPDGSIFANEVGTAITDADGVCTVLFGMGGATATLSVTRQNTTPGTPLLGTNTPGTPADVDFDDDTYLGQDGSTGSYLDANLHSAGFGYFTMDATDADIIEQFVDTSTGLPRSPGADGTNYLDGAEEWEVILQNTSASHVTNTADGAGGNPTGSNSGDATSPGEWADDYVPAGGSPSMDFSVASNSMYVPVI